MPLGKQAVAYTLASSFAMVAAKCRMLLLELFHFSFFLALSVGSAFINTTPTFCERGGSFVFPSHSGLGGEQGPPAAKMRRCITGEPALAERKISCALRVVPPSLQAVWESSGGLVFLCNPAFKNTAPTFSLGGSFCVSHSLRDCEERWGPL